MNSFGVITSSAISEARFLAWGSLGVVSCYYVALSIAFRWHSKSVVVTRYEPPRGISPSMAAYLIQNGECQRAFAARIISLAARGYLGIYASGEQFHVAKVHDAAVSVPEEESALLSALFPGQVEDCEFGGTDPGSLQQALNKFREAMDGIAWPELLSQHSIFWLMGIIYSLVYVPLFAYETMLSFPIRTPIASLVYLCIWIGMGAACLIAALRLWPTTFRKIVSRLPGINQPRIRFKYSDANPIFLTLSALAGFGLLAAETSVNFAGLIGMIVIIGSASRHFLEVPTRKGKVVLSELRNFREFLMRTEADRLSRGIQAQDGQLQFEKYSAYAVALDIERGWGEEFATQLMQAFEFDHAYSFSFLPLALNTSLPEDHFLQLNLQRVQEPGEKIAEGTKN
jgi:predicted membrane protein DUF2207